MSKTSIKEQATQIAAEAINRARHKYSLQGTSMTPGYFLLGDPGWVAFYDYFTRIGVLDHERFNEWRDRLVKLNAWQGHLFDRVAIIVEKHTGLRRDPEKRMHSDQEPAIEWADGTCLYFLSGVEFDKPLWEKVVSQTLELPELMEIGNADRRSVAMSMLRPDLLLDHVNAELINTGVKGTRLYKVPDFMGRGSTEYCMRMTCPSTGREFIEWVQPEIGEQGDADLAQASAWEDQEGNPLSLEDYLTSVEA